MDSYYLAHFRHKICLYFIGLKRILFVKKQALLFVNV